MMLLATVAPGQAVQAAVEQLLKVRGNFRRWAGVITVRAVGSAIVALTVGVVLGDDATATAIAAAIAGFVTVEAIIEVVVIGGRLGLPVARFWWSTLPLWAILAGTGWAAAWAVSRLDAPAWPAAAAGALLVAVVASVVLVVARRRGLVDTVHFSG